MDCSSDPWGIPWVSIICWAEYMHQSAPQASDCQCRAGCTRLLGWYAGTSTRTYSTIFKVLIYGGHFVLTSDPCHCNIFSSLHWDPRMPCKPSLLLPYDKDMNNPRMLHWKCLSTRLPTEAWRLPSCTPREAWPAWTNSGPSHPCEYTQCQLPFFKCMQIVTALIADPLNLLSALSPALLSPPTTEA